jgi:hypothetical protein
MKSGYIHFSKDDMREIEHNELKTIDLSETHSRFGSKQLSLLQKYQIKYPKDTYVIFNSNLELERKSWTESCHIIIDKLSQHPYAYSFCVPLDQENLGDLYDTYHSMIKNPMELMMIKDKLTKDEYESSLNFANDVSLIFSNCKSFNVKGSLLYDYATQLEDFFKILFEPLKKSG